jgi:hypothetical protein
MSNSYLVAGLMPTVSATTETAATGQGEFGMATQRNYFGAISEAGHDGIYTNPDHD